MPASRGKCTNSDCDMSLEESIEVAEGATFKCPSCSQPLQSSDRTEGAVQKLAPPGPGRNPVRAKIVMGTAALIVLAAGWGVSRWIQGDPRIELSATTLIFKFQQIGKGEGIQEIVLKNIGKSGNLDIESVSCSSPDFSARKPSTGIRPGQSARLEIVFKPTTPGQHDATLTIESDDATQPKLTIQLSGRAGKLGPWWIWEQWEQTSQAFEK